MPILFSVLQRQRAFIDENDGSYVKSSSDTSKEDWIKWCKFLKISSTTNAGPNDTIQTDKKARYVGKSPNKQRIMQELYSIINTSNA